MVERYAIVPEEVAVSTDAPRQSLVVFEIEDDHLDVVSGNESLVRVLLRELQSARPAHRCVEEPYVDAHGGPGVEHVTYTSGDTLRGRLLGWLGLGSNLLIGRDRLALVPCEPSADARPPLDRAGEIDVGPQNPGDAPFTARMRFHQSWYRAAVLQAPAGTGPGPESRRVLGNMLTEPDGAAGLNFVRNDVYVMALDRLGQDKGVVERFRLLHNLLSSQPMCFNIFGPLKADIELATAVWNELRVPWTAADDGSSRSRTEQPWSVRRVTNVEIEHAPEPVEEYLDDRTAFDAFVEYECRDGSLGFIGIETKLTEPFSPKEVDGEKYRRWMRGDRSPWRPDVEAGVFSDIEHNQLWRDHLLAVALRDHPGSKYRHGCLALVRHPLDEHCAKVSADYRALLKPGDPSFIDLTIEDVVATMETSLGAARWEPWMRDLRTRYLDLGQGEVAWRKQLQGRTPEARPSTAPVPASRH